MKKGKITYNSNSKRFGQIKRQVKNSCSMISPRQRLNLSVLDDYSEPIYTLIKETNPTTKQRDEDVGIYLYILELQNNKYYVGITNNPEKRFKRHCKGTSLSFVKKNLPIIHFEKILLKTKDRKRAEELETEKTIELMQKYGIDNVNGGALIGDYHEKIMKLKLLFNVTLD